MAVLISLFFVDDVEDPFLELPFDFGGFSLGDVISLDSEPYKEDVDDDDDGEELKFAPEMEDDEDVEVEWMIAEPPFLTLPNFLDIIDTTFDLCVLASGSAILSARLSFVARASSVSPCPPQTKGTLLMAAFAFAFVCRHASTRRAEERKTRRLPDGGRCVTTARRETDVRDAFGGGTCVARAERCLVCRAACCLGWLCCFDGDAIGRIGPSSWDNDNEAVHTRHCHEPPTSKLSTWHNQHHPSSFPQPVINNNQLSTWHNQHHPPSVPQPVINNNQLSM